MSSFIARSGFALDNGLSSSSLLSLPFIDIAFNNDEMYNGIYNDKKKHANDLELVLQRAKECGVRKIIATGTTSDDSIECVNFCKQYKKFYETKLYDNEDDSITSTYGLYSTCGIHPTRCNEFINQEDILIEKLANTIDNNREEIIAIGECGLDYDRLKFCTKENQIRGFQLQLDLASRYTLPLFLHNRNTGGDFLQMVRENRDKIKGGGVVHSFDGNVEEMRALIDLGLYIGINGCSLKTEESLNVVKEIPTEFLMIETDAPWCGIKTTHAGFKHVKSLTNPTLYKKKEKFEPCYLVKDRNEPCTVLQVFDILCEIRQVDDKKKFAEDIYSNTEKLFFPR